MIIRVQREQFRQMLAQITAWLMRISRLSHSESFKELYYNPYHKTIHIASQCIIFYWKLNAKPFSTSILA